MSAKISCALPVVIFTVILFGVTHFSADAITSPSGEVPGPVSTILITATAQATSTIQATQQSTDAPEVQPPQLPTGGYDHVAGDVPSTDCEVSGWAMDPSDPYQDVNVRILVDGAPLVQNLVAENYREDLETSWNQGSGGCPDGNCAFELNLWDLISRYQPHQIRVEAQDLQTGHWVPLHAEPKTLTCHTYDIYVYDPLTGEVKSIVYLPDTDEANPSWSPNQRQIAYDVLYGNGTQEIYITDLKTGTTKPLFGAGRGSNDAVWSPDGKWIAFDRAENGSKNLYLIPPAGGQARQIRKAAVSADWAPGSQRLVFQDLDGSLRTMAVDGGAGGETTIAERGGNPTWSRDGKWIAYDQDGDIWKVPVNALGVPQGETVALTIGPYHASQPSWSADSTTITYQADSRDNIDLYTISAVGGSGAWLIGAQMFPDTDPAYGMHGSMLAYASYSASIQTPPSVNLRVNYGNDWIESFYEIGHTVTVMVTESDGVTVKATAEVFTEPKEIWENNTGFTTDPQDWLPSQPDIQPGDWVYEWVDNGASDQLQIGDIQGQVRFDLDSATGTVQAPWLKDPVQVECLDWSGTKMPPASNQKGGVISPDGEDTYRCAWDPDEWDIQPWQDIGVGYLTPNGSWVANAFRDERWMAFWTGDLAPGSWIGGEHTYHFQTSYVLPMPGGNQVSPSQVLNVSSGISVYPGKVLLQASSLTPQVAWTGNTCQVVPAIHPDQATRFVWGWVNDSSMTYEQAFEHFSSMTVKALWDGGSLPLTMGELLPWTSENDSEDNRCSLTKHNAE